MRRRGALAAAVLGASLPAQSADDATLEALSSFYQGAMCGTAVVASVQRENDQAIVHLDIDPRWAAVLPRMEPELRDRYFALHCPSGPMLRALRADIAEEDIVIEAELPGDSLHRHICGAG